MAKGFIMMTALPPTYGHKQLIEWAREYCYSAGIPTLHVMVCSKPNEPYRHRWSDLAVEVLTEPYWGDVAALDGKTIIYNFHKDMPDKPEQDSMFWPKWQAEIFKTVGTFEPDDVVFSSEEYGIPLARVLGAKPVVYDPDRVVVRARASNIRNQPFKHFRDMLPSAQNRFRKTVTIFGAESTGKTTLAKALAVGYNGQFAHYTPEWARPYLESLSSPEVTDERMETIVHGQRATENAARSLKDKPFIVRDTDLLSTVGYYRLYSPDRVPLVAVDIADLHPHLHPSTP